MEPLLCTSHCCSNLTCALSNLNKIFEGNMIYLLLNPWVRVMKNDPEIYYIKNRKQWQHFGTGSLVPVLDL